MVVARRVGPGGLSISLLLLLSSATNAAAQQAPSGIAGLVKDASGGILPGVTVEAASPVLIERVRSVTTDSDGRYNIIDLRPGTYTVTFSLPGFNTYRREGIAISVGFTATVNVDLAVGSPAESSSPNVAMNMVPKEGANTFRFSIEGLFTNHSFQSSNLDSSLEARQITEVPKLNRMYDAGFTVGGPIRQDKVWFFATVRRWGVRNQAAGLYWNKTPGTPVYTPDPTRPAFRDERYQSHAVRVTWQVSQRNKVNIFTDIKKDCICASGGAGSSH